MRSLLLEFLRLNNLATGIWREGDPYLVAAGSEYPIRQFSSPLEHEKFLDLTRALRYQGDAEGRGSPAGNRQDCGESARIPEPERRCRAAAFRCSSTSWSIRPRWPRCPSRRPRTARELRCSREPNRRWCSLDASAPPSPRRASGGQRSRGCSMRGQLHRARAMCQPQRTKRPCARRWGRGCRYSRGQATAVVAAVLATLAEGDSRAA